MMKEGPIIFSGEMIRATFDGRKTQTRRVITARNSTVDGYGVTSKSQLWAGLNFSDVYTDDSWSEPEHPYIYLKVAHSLGTRHRVRCRWEPGDRLWVRETWQYHKDNHYIWYRADDTLWVKSPYGGMHQVPLMPPRPYKWRPSIFMPRWASRIKLEVTGIRAERVQDIDQRDISLEGYPDGVKWYIDWFRDLWDSINAKRSYGWDVNPWVWVVEFQMLTPPH